MKVVQWNLHHGGVPVDSTSKAYPVNVAAVTAKLVSFVPDLVCLNELEQNDGYGHLDQLEAHRAALEASQGIAWSAYFTALNGGSKSQGIGIGILSSSILTSPTRKDLGGRPGMLTTLSSGLLVGATHPDPDSAARRSAELAQLLIMLALAGASKQVICGDFNASPTAVELAPWPVLYKDAWAEALKLGKATSFLPGGITHSKSRIDYIFYKGLTVTSCDVPDTSTNGIFPSDHHPVIATFA